MLISQVGNARDAHTLLLTVLTGTGAMPLSCCVRRYLIACVWVHIAVGPDVGCVNSLSVGFGDVAFMLYREG